MCIRVNDQSLVRECNSQEAEDKSRLSQFFNKYRSKRNPRKGWNITEDRLIAIERFVTDAIALNRPGYLKVCNKSGRLEFVGALFSKSYFHQLNGYLLVYSKDCFYSPQVELFFSACRELNLLGHEFVVPVAVNAQGVTDAELFNRLIDKIREKGRAPQYRNKVAQDRYRAFDRFYKNVNYVDALFEHVRSRLIIIRLDLKYRSEHVTNMKVGQAQDDLAHFFSNMRNKPVLFDDLVGYIWKLERSDHGSDHFHVMLFFSNDRLRNDSYRSEQIGQYWEDVITKGRGCYFSCNRQEYKDQQKRLSVSRIEHDDHEKRYNLLYQLAYFCKEEQRIRAKPKQKSRAYGRGEMPQIKETRRGRSRSVIMQPKAYLAYAPLAAASKSPPKSFLSIS